MVTPIARVSTLVLAAATCLPGAALARQHPELPGGPVEGADFRVYDARGRDRSFADLLAAVDRIDALLVGEEHDDVTGHRVESEILLRAAQRLGALAGPEAGRPVVLSLEMFERDVQYVLDEYLQGLITEDQFKRSSRPWERYDTDYRPMLEIARAHRLPVVAANAPRRYVNRVTRLGPASLNDLSEAAKAFLPPLPYPGASERYAGQWNRLMAEMMAPKGDSGSVRSERETAPATPEPPSEAGEEAPRHDLGNALDAQALWDASMAESITQALGRRPGALVVHYAGSFHVQWHTGIPEKVIEYRPGTRVLTVVMQPVTDVGAWSDDEHRDLADFVILTARPDTPPGSEHGVRP